MAQVVEKWNKDMDSTEISGLDIENRQNYSDGEIEIMISKNQSLDESEIMELKQEESK